MNRRCGRNSRLVDDVLPPLFCEEDETGSTQEEGICRGLNVKLPSREEGIAEIRRLPSEEHFSNIMNGKEFEVVGQEIRNKREEILNRRINTVLKYPEKRLQKFLPESVAKNVTTNFQEHIVIGHCKQQENAPKMQTLFQQGGVSEASISLTAVNSKVTSKTEGSTHSEYEIALRKISRSVTAEKVRRIRMEITENVVFQKGTSDRQGLFKSHLDEMLQAPPVERPKSSSVSEESAKNRVGRHSLTGRHNQISIASVKACNEMSHSTKSDKSESRKSKPPVAIDENAAVLMYQRNVLKKYLKEWAHFVRLRVMKRGVEVESAHRQMLIDSFIKDLEKIVRLPLRKNSTKGNRESVKNVVHKKAINLVGGTGVHSEQSSSSQLKSCSRYESHQRIGQNFEKIVFLRDKYARKTRIRSEDKDAQLEFSNDFSCEIRECNQHIEETMNEIHSEDILSTYDTLRSLRDGFSKPIIRHSCIYPKADIPQFKVILTRNLNSDNHKRLSKMENRELERKNRREVLRKRKEQRNSDRLRKMKAELQEKKDSIRLNVEEKMKDYDECCRRNEEAKIRLEEEKVKNLIREQKAKKYCRYKLLYMGLLALKSLSSLRKDESLHMDAYYKRKLLRRHFSAWYKCILTGRDDSEDNVWPCYHRRLTKFPYCPLMLDPMTEEEPGRLRKREKKDKPYGPRRYNSPVSGTDE